MPMFKVEARDGSKALIVRAYCFTCARKVAAMESPANEFDLWSSHDKVKTTWLPDRYDDGIDGIKEVLK